MGHMERFRLNVTLDSWIESVKTVDEETNTLPDLTEWTLATKWL